MAVILPFIFFIFLAGVLYLKISRPLAFILLAAAVLMGSGTILLTEILSFFKILNYPAVLVLWLVADIGICWELFRLKGSLPRLSWPLKIEKSLLVMAVILFLLVILPVSLTALKAAPGSWDSMTYHLARVEHWVQNHSLVYYPTNIERQLWKDYGGELFVTHFRILTGGDSLCNVVQLLAWFGCMLVGIAILGLWQCSSWEKLLAVTLMATIPMSILQASSTQTDLIGNFWLMAFVFFIMDALTADRTMSVCLSSLALGISLLTRETNYLYAWPFVVWLIISAWRKKGFSKACAVLGIILSGILLVNAAHYARNIIFYHRILSPGSEDLVNEHWTLATLAVNALRNTVMHITTPFLNINDQTLSFVGYWAGQIGINIQDPSSMVTEKFNIAALFLDEDYAQNPLHLILLIILMVVTVARCIFFREDRWKGQAVFVLALVAGMATFSLILKWQPWNSRMQMGIFMLSAIPAAVMIARLQARWVMIVVMILFIVPSLLWVVRNDNRPLIGSASIWTADRHEQYYRKRFALAIHDKTAAEIFKRTSCSQLGLVFGEDSWEYPFWVLMREQAGHQLRMEHVDIQNTTSKFAYPLGDFNPCGLYMQPSDGRSTVSVQGNFYRRVWETSLPDGSKSAVFVPEF